MSAPRIRRVAPFNPTDITGCSLWLDAADTSSSSFTYSSGSNISLWKDKSGSANNFSLTSGTTSSINDGGNTVVNFPSGAFMTSANQITFTTSSAFFIVSRYASPSAPHIAMLLAFPDINSGDKSIRYYQNVLAGSGGLYGDGNDLANGAYYVNGKLNPGFESDVYVNVYSITDTIAPTSGGTSYLTLSSSWNGRYFIGNIAEFIYYAGGVTSTQREQLEGYLAQKWGLRGSFPTNHPGVTNTIVPIQRVAKAIPVLYYTAFNPSQISGCQIWLDAADSTTHTFSDSLLTAWRDKSTNAYNFNQLAPAASGLSVTNAVIGTPINGLRTLYFDPGASIYQSSVLDGVTNVFWVGRIATGGGNYFLFGANSYYDWHAQTYPGKFLEISPYAQTGIRDASPSSLFTSDAAATTNAAFSAINMPTAPAVSILSVAGITGSTRFQGLCYDRNDHTGWCGDLAEVITFNAAITTTQRQQIESYLAQKWGLVPQLPANHLHATLPAGTPTFTQSVFGRVRNTFLPSLVGITATGGDVVHVANGYKSHIFVGVGSQTLHSLTIH